MKYIKLSNFSIPLAVIVLFSCGGGGGGGSSDPYTPPSTPNPSASISANPSNLYVNETVTISWTSTNADTCIASGEWDGEKDTVGSQQLIVSNVGTLTYSITCSSGNKSAKADAVVIANPINTTGKYQAPNQSHVYIESDKSNLYNTPVSWQYSLRKHSGYTYGNSANGEPVIFGAGFYGNMVLTCRNANLNGDSYPDLVVQSSSGWQANDNVDENDFINPERRPRIHFLINSGNGFFEDGSSLLDTNDDYFRINTYKDIFIADVNGDGLDDVLTGSGGGGGRFEEAVDDGILLLLSNNQGKYVDSTDLIQHPRITRNRGDFSEDVLGIAGADTFIAADVNNDGLKDLVTFAVANQENRGPYPLVHMNKNNSSFEPWEPFVQNNEPVTAAEWNSTRGSMVADYDQDGDDDIFVLCYSDCFYQKEPEQINGQEPLYDPKRNNGFVLINNNGTFLREDIIHFPEGLHGPENKNDAIAVGDVNGDGLPDVVISQGKFNPYYIDRDIQILINNGSSFVDETSTRIVNLRNDYNGHAEGHTYLVDFDKDGDLDIFDFQNNVSNGYSQWNNNAPTQEDKKFPYWRWGGALFINDGSGNFSYAEEDISDTGELATIYESWKIATFNEPGHQCPVDFGGDYGFGIGFEGSAGEPAPNINIPEGYDVEEININGFAVGRKINAVDSFKTDSQTKEETIVVSFEPNANGYGNVYVIDGLQKKSITLNEGTSYIFNHPTSHPLRFSTTEDGIHNGGSEFTDGVSKTSGVTVLKVTSNTPKTLYYYCQLHSGMGADIRIN